LGRLRAVTAKTGLVAGLLMLTLIPSGAAPGAGYAPTQLHVFNAFTPDAKLTAGLHVLGKVVRGSCWEGAVLDQRSDAWRCTHGDRLYDPCFVNGVGVGSLAACPLTPWGRRVVLLRLTKKLPLHYANRNRPVTHLLPWGIVTGSGKHCFMLSGATATVAGQRINYGCSGGGQLIGSPQRDTSRWTILFERNFNAHQLTSVGIAAAWW
jgi:hypothetical protein